MLVLTRDQAMSVAGGERYDVIGTVRSFELAGAEAELGYELDDQLFADWGDRTVIIADEVLPRGR